MEEKEIKTKFDVYKYLGIIKRRKYFFIVPLILICAGFFVAGYLLPKVYLARAVILVEQKNIVNPLLNKLAVSTPVAARLTSLREEIFAWPRLFQLVEKMGLNEDVNGPVELERLISGIRQNIFLRMKSKEIVTISYLGEDPKKTQELVNTLCEILIERSTSIQTEDTGSAIAFINEQLVVYKEKLDLTESELRKFREIYGLGILSDSETKSSDLGSADIDAKVSPAGVALSQVNTEVAALEADLLMASIDCTDDHPRVKEIKNRIASLRLQRKDYIQRVADETGLDAAAYMDIADSVPRQQEELASLTRGNAINERIYAMLLERLETAKITESLDNSENRTKFRIIEPARLPYTPVKPNKFKINILGLFLGLAISFGFVYLLEYTDSSVKGEDDLKESFGYPVLGNISKIVTEEELNQKSKTSKKIVIIFIVVTFGLAIVAIALAKLKVLF